MVIKYTALDTTIPTKPRRNWCCVYSKEKPDYMDFYSEKVSFTS